MKDFLDSCKYKSEISEAIAYERKLSYFIQTNLNSDVYVNVEDSINNLWISENPFMNWVKSWMRRENFQSFMKFLRHPLPTASLVQDDIIPELQKVFDATNAFYDYKFTSNGTKSAAEEIIEQNSNYCKDVVFDALIYSHNSIVITDYIESSNPYRYLVNIRNVKAIEPDTTGDIKKIVFVGTNSDGDERWYYYTNEFYSVYTEKDGEFTFESQNYHTIGKCPADFISVDSLNTNKFVIRKSIFSNFVEKFENYVNYYTLQKMCLPHGAIPVITHYKPNNAFCESKFENGTQCVKGYLSGQNGILASKDSLTPCPVCNSKTIIQAGTVVTFPVPKFGDNGERPMDLNANFVKFHYIPVDILEWWNKFVDEKYSEIKYQLVGKGVEQSNGQAKNKDQISRGNQTLENTLISFSSHLSKLQTSLDWKTLTIVFQKSFIGLYIDKGTDFYLETEFQLRDSLEKAIDPIDKANIISRINYSLYKNNPTELERNSLMYKLLPYSTISDSEFIGMQNVDPKLRELRLNYQYYISSFEAEYGRLNVFFNNLRETMPMIKKLEMANYLLFKYINITDYESISLKTDVGERNPI